MIVLAAPWIFKLAIAGLGAYAAHQYRKAAEADRDAARWAVTSTYAIRSR